MTETTPVPGYEGFYEIDRDGNVTSLRRKTPHQLSPALNGKGYAFVGLHRPNARRRLVEVHLLVAEAFIGPRPDGAVVRHLDGDRKNNSVKNLAYGTVSENNLDTVAHGRHRNARKVECINGHPFDGANTYMLHGARYCRACNRSHVAAYKAKRMADL